MASHDQQPGAVQLQASPIDLPDQNITVKGAFNPAILRPPWVSRNLPAVGKDVEALLGMEGPLFYRGGGITWSATRESLVVYGDPDRIGSFVSELLKVLPHTPLTAAGFNIRFRRPCARPGSVGPWRIESDVSIERLLRGRDTEAWLARVVERGDKVRLTTKAAWRTHARTSVVFDFNYHLNASSALETDRARELGSHAARAPEFAKDASRIVEELIDE